MLNHWKSKYYFYYFYSYIHPGFLPLFLEETNSIFCQTGVNFITAPSIEKYEKWLKGTSNLELSNYYFKDGYDFIQPTIEENYEFVRNYFGMSLCICILLLRVIRNPTRIKEIRHLLSNKKINTSHESPSQKNIRKLEERVNTEGSVIISNLNRKKYIKNILNNLNTRTV